MLHQDILDTLTAYNVQYELKNNIENNIPLLYNSVILNLTDTIVGIFNPSENFVTIVYNGTDKDFVESLQKYAKNFDIEKETDRYVTNHIRKYNTKPTYHDIANWYHNMQDKKANLCNIAGEVYETFLEINQEEQKNEN